MLTLEQKATNYETFLHIQQVQKLLNRVIVELLKRSELHDQSKLASPEVEMFTEFTPKLAASTYGSEEYEEFRKAMGPALAHHYAKNRHHPEHFRNGILDMDIVDFVEMFCDWKAATIRHNDGNILKSIEHNSVRFSIGTELRCILQNTAKWLE
jgi:hypothetical protein